MEGKGVGLDGDLTLRAEDFKLVQVPLGNIGEEDFPHAAAHELAHRIAPAIPRVEFTDDADPLGIRRPDGKVDPARPFMVDQMRAQLVEQPQMRALGDEEIVGRPQHRAEAVGIGHPPFVPAALATVFYRLARALDRCFEQSAIIHPLEWPKFLARKVMCRGILSPRQDRARKGSLRTIVHAKQGKGISVGALQQCSNCLARWLHKTPQMSFAYSLMVRSDENQPTLAMLCIADLRQRA